MFAGHGEAASAELPGDRVGQPRRRPHRQAGRAVLDRDDGRRRRRPDGRARDRTRVPRRHRDGREHRARRRAAASRSRAQARPRLGERPQAGADDTRGADARRDRPALAAAVSGAATPSPSTRTHASATRRAPTTAPPGSARSDNPVLILHGRRDRTVPLRLAEEMQDRIAGSKLVTFDGGHGFFFTRERAEFADRVAAFVRSTPMSSQPVSRSDGVERRDGEQRHLAGTIPGEPRYPANTPRSRAAAASGPAGVPSPAEQSTYKDVLLS